MEGVGGLWGEGVSSGDYAKFIVEKKMFKCETPTYCFISTDFFFFHAGLQLSTINCLTNCRSPENSSSRTNTCLGVWSLTYNRLCFVPFVTSQRALHQNCVF